MGGKRGPSKWYVPEAVYMSEDGGEWCIRKMANGYHVIGPYTTGSLGYWPTLLEAARIILRRAGSRRGQWTEYKESARDTIFVDA